MRCCDSRAAAILALLAEFADRKTFTRPLRCRSEFFATSVAVTFADIVVWVSVAGDESLQVLGGTMSAQFDMGRAIARIFTVFAANFIPFLALAVLTVVPPLLAGWLVARALPGAGVVFSPAYWAAIPFYLLVGLFSLVMSYALQAAVVQGTVATLDGRRASFVQCLGTAVRSTPKLVVIAIVASIGIIGGMVLLVVPGVILALMWSVVVPACVVEQKSIGDSFSRSAALTKGHRWAILGILVVLTIAILAITLAIRPLAGLHVFPTPGEPVQLNTLYWIISMVVRIFTATVAAIATASIYYELRTIKEGATSDQLAAVFA